jgi:HSP20 family molecular chaperone IbpA
MKPRQDAIGKKQHPAGIVVLSQAGIAELSDQIRETIAHRAYEIFERRGRAHAHDLADWFRAESEIVRDLPYKIQELADQILVRIDLTDLDPTTLQVGVEPRRIIVRGRRLPSHDRRKELLGDNGNDGEAIGLLDLPTEVDRAKAKAVIKGTFLEVVAQKRRT